MSTSLVLYDYYHRIIMIQRLFLCLHQYDRIPSIRTVDGTGPCKSMRKWSTATGTRSSFHSMRLWRSIKHTNSRVERSSAQMSFGTLYFHVHWMSASIFVFAQLSDWSQQFKADRCCCCSESSAFWTNRCLHPVRFMFVRGLLSFFL